MHIHSMRTQVMNMVLGILDTDDIRIHTGTGTSVRQVSIGNWYAKIGSYWYQGSVQGTLC